MKKTMRYPLTHQIGFISIEKELKPSMIKGDLGIQISEDGKIWICLNGEALIRFKPTMADCHI